MENTKKKVVVVRRKVNPVPVYQNDVTEEQRLFAAAQQYNKERNNPGYHSEPTTMNGGRKPYYHSENGKPGYGKSNSNYGKKEPVSSFKKKGGKCKTKVYNAYFHKVKSFNPVLEFKKMQHQFTKWIKMGAKKLSKSNFVEYAYNYYDHQVVLFKLMRDFWEPENIKQFMETHKDEKIFYDPETDADLTERVYRDRMLQMKLYMKEMAKEYKLHMKKCQEKQERIHKEAKALDLIIMEDDD